MEEIAERINNMKVEDFKENSSCWVDITHIINPQQFFTRQTELRDAVKTIENLQPKLKKPRLQALETILYNLENNTETPKYARGLITKVKKTENTVAYEIYALDYGYQENNVTHDRIFFCDDYLSCCPPLATLCMLANCAPKAGQDSSQAAWGEAVEVFKELVRDQHFKMVIEGKISNKLIVKLFNGLDDIASVLALTDFTTLGYVPNHFNKIQSAPIPQIISYYTFHKFKLNETLHVRVVSGETLKSFYVAEINDYKKYLDNSDDFKYYSEKEPPLDEKFAKCGDLVSVKNFMNKYERGLIKEILCTGKRYKACVHLVDLGKDEVVRFSSIRLLPQKYVSTPVVGIFCSALESPASTHIHNLLHQGRELLIKITQLGQGFETPNVVKIQKKN